MGSEWRIEKLSMRSIYQISPFPLCSLIKKKFIALDMNSYTLWCLQGSNIFCCINWLKWRCLMLNWPHWLNRKLMTGHIIKWFAPHITLFSIRWRYPSRIFSKLLDRTVLIVCNVHDQYYYRRLAFYWPFIERHSARAKSKVKTISKTSYIYQLDSE